jgi:hypothetical protein
MIILLLKLQFFIRKIFNSNDSQLNPAGSWT